MKDLSPLHNCCEYSNEELVSLAQRGETFALALLTKRFLKINRVRYPAGYLEIDDLNQEGMLGFLSAVRTYSPDKGASFETYASRCINNRIKSVAGRTLKKTADEEPITDTASSGLVNPLDAVYENERLGELVDVITAELSERERKVLGMYIIGFSACEIAGNLGINQKSVDNALQRAKRKLKQHYNDAGQASF